jgi:hypothetical protein
VGKGTFQAYEKGEWGRDVVGTWGALIIFDKPIRYSIDGNSN